MILAVIVIVLLGFGLFKLIQTKAPADLQSATVGEAAAAVAAAVNGDNVAAPATLAKFQFFGYGPGKAETGTFKEMSVSNLAVGADGVPTAGHLTIKTASVDAGKEMLNKHLCSEDFFNCAANPEITFDLTSIAKTGDGTYDVTGNLTFNSVTKEFTFPATATPDGKYSADFKFDTTFFNFKYTAIDKEVRIQFEGQVR
jgi:polyisoprenoid-binding protein YceI